MRRYLLSTSLALLALLLLALPAGAGVSWCRSDPIISLNGKVSNTWVLTPNEIFLERANAPTRVVYTIPEDVEAELLFTDEGFGLGYEVRFVSSRTMSVNPDGSIPVKVAIFVPSNKSFPVMVQWEPVGHGVTASANGVTNNWISITTVMP